MAYSYLNNINLKKNTRSQWYGGLSMYRDNLLCDVVIKEIIRAATYEFKGFTITKHSVEISNVKDTKEDNTHSTKKIILVAIMYTKHNRKIPNDKITSKIKSYVFAQIESHKYSNIFNENKTDYSLQIDVLYDNKPFSSPFYVAQQVASNMIFRINLRKLELITQKTVQQGNIGCIIEIEGRINGHGIKRKDRVIYGKVPRNTLNLNIVRDKYTYIGKSGTVGINVWINLGAIK